MTLYKKSKVIESLKKEMKRKLRNGGYDYISFGEATLFNKILLIMIYLIPIIIIFISRLP